MAITKPNETVSRNLFHKLLIMPESEIEAAWLDEAERRARAIDQGLVQLIPGEEVRRKAQNLLR